MLKLVLTLWLVNGAVIHEPITREDCRELMSVAQYVYDSGANLSRPEGQISALKCDGQAIVLMLPASAGDCEATS